MKRIPTGNYSTHYLTIVLLYGEEKQESRFLGLTSGQNDLTQGRIARFHYCEPHLIHSSLDQRDSASQTCISIGAAVFASSRQRVPIFYNGPRLSPSNRPFAWGIRTPSNARFLWPNRVYVIPNCTSNGPAAFAGSRL